LAGAALRSHEIQQCNIRAILHSFKHDFVTIWRQIEVANIEAGRQISQLPFSSGIQVYKPKVFVMDLSSQNYKSAASR